MTAQMPDTLDYQGQQFDIIGVDGEGLFTPEDFGMRPAGLHTACYRGYVAGYRFEGEHLFLTQVTLGAVKEPWKPIGGQLPTRRAAQERALYENLLVQVPFHGRLIMAKDVFHSLTRMTGFQRPTAHHILFECTFDKGHLTKIVDLSVQNARKRTFIRKRTGGDELLWSKYFRNDLTDPFFPEILNEDVALDEPIPNLLSFLKEQAQQDDKIALFDLALLSSEYPEAIDLLLQLEKVEKPEVQEALGMLFERQAQPQRAILYYTKATKLGEKRAFKRILQLLDKEGLEQEACLHKLSEQGILLATEQLIKSIEQLKGEEKKKRLIQLHAKTALGGDTKSYEQLAEMAHQGSEEALAEMYEFGEGTDFDENAAAAFYNKHLHVTALRCLAVSNNADAQFYLGEGYKNESFCIDNLAGYTTEESQKRALYWYKKAAEQGHVEAKKQLRMLEQTKQSRQ